MKTRESSLKLDAARCTGCGACLDVCPHGVFALAGGRARIERPQGCMECGACRRNCRFGAIAVDTGVGCAAALISGALRGSEPCCGGREGEDNCC